MNTVQIEQIEREMKGQEIVRVQFTGYELAIHLKNGDVFLVKSPDVNVELMVEKNPPASVKLLWPRDFDSAHAGPEDQEAS